MVGGLWCWLQNPQHTLAISRRYTAHVVMTIDGHDFHLPMMWSGLPMIKPLLAGQAKLFIITCGLYDEHMVQVLIGG
jgi:hypothetical protein